VEVVGEEDVGEAEQVGGFVDAYFEVHLEGEEVEVEVVNVPAQQSPSGLLGGDRVGAGVRVGGYSVGSVVAGSHKNAIVCVSDWTVDDFLGHRVGQAKHVVPVDARCHLETQRRLVVHLDGLLPKQLQNVHHSRDCLSESGGGVHLLGIVAEKEANGAEWQRLQSARVGGSVIDRN